MPHFAITLLLLALIAAGCGQTAATADASARLDTSPEADETEAGVDARPWVRPDARVEGPDATSPDEGAVDFVTGPDCTVARFEGPFDGSAACSPRRSRPCTCADGRAGAEVCLATSTWGACACTFVDGGLQRTDAVATVMEDPIPWSGRPRLLAPQSGSRVTSTRPSLRWLLPAGLARARVELCADRACVRAVQQHETSEESWRSATPLAPGVTFWRVRGLDAGGVVRWTSATWEFAVGRRDRGVDISFGTVKDFNGDGYDDLAVNGVRNWEGAGIRLFLGSSDGVDEGHTVALQPALPPGAPQDLSSYGDFAESFSVGDFNGDGLADLAVGAPRYIELPGLMQTGRVFVYMGHRSCGAARYEGIYRAADDQLVARYGNVVSAGGDFNGDGYGDMVVSGFGGNAQLHLGGPRGLQEAPADVALFTGPNAHFVGDLNADGYADLIVQHWVTSIGVLSPFFVCYGNPEGVLGLRTQVINVWELHDTALGHNARGGDFNEDGYGDIALSGNGDVAIFYGSSEGLGPPTRLESLYSGPGGDLTSNFGGKLAVGDFDGDGHLEIAVSQPFAPAVRDPELRDGPGMLHLYGRGPGTDTIGTRPTFSITGSPTGGFGFGVPTAPGDLNGDGGDDISVGATSVGLMGPSQLWIYHAGVPGWQRSPTRVFTQEYAFVHNVK